MCDCLFVFFFLVFHQFHVPSHFSFSLLLARIVFFLSCVLHTCKTQSDGHCRTNIDKHYTESERERERVGDSGSNKQYVIEIIFIYMSNQIQLYNAIRKQNQPTVVVDPIVSIAPMRARYRWSTTDNDPIELDATHSI